MRQLTKQVFATGVHRALVAFASTMLACVAPAHAEGFEDIINAIAPSSVTQKVYFAGLAVRTTIAVVADEPVSKWPRLFTAMRTTMRRSLSSLGVVGLDVGAQRQERNQFDLPKFKEGR